MVTNKKILITAGPTWVAIDKTRVISNIASGQTGFILAEKLKKLGVKVTLLLGPGNFYGCQTGIRVIRFKYFSELAQLMDRELRNGKFTAVIHTAAVSDYRTKKIIQCKVSSLRKSWKLNLVPTEKLINNLKIYQPQLFTVGFKFEPNTNKNKLIEKGRILQEQANLNLVVANSDKNSGYQAYILDKQDNYGPFLTKTKMAIYLSNLIKNKLLVKNQRQP
ncbi:MAG: phosphopantothenoylcysteine decarboxylase [Candidatus Omnitrophica bacterium]|nr:phosphopantothenoylcysteine decarboxylase [Candidatus Omnitrophota bacterium]